MKFSEKWLPACEKKLAAFTRRGQQGVAQRGNWWEQFKKACWRLADLIRNARLRSRVFLPFALAIMVIVFTFGQLAANLITSKMAELTREKAASALEDTLHEFEKYEAETELAAEIAATDPELAQAMQNPHFASLWNLLTPAQERFHFRRLLLFDAERKPLLARGTLPEPLPALTFLIVQGLNGTSGSTLITTPSSVEVFAAVPVMGDGKVAGVLVASRDTRSEFLQAKERTGVEVALSHQGENIMSTTPSDLIPRDVFYVTLSRQIPGSDITLTVMVPTDDIEKIQSALAGGLRRIIVMGLLIVLVIGLMLANSISRPLLKIAEATRLYSEGQFNYRVEVSGGQEIRQLSDAINLMASSVEGRLEDAQRQANIDGLTQLYNHLYFYDRLAAEIQRADRFNSSFGIIFCDLDDFKLYNDQNGHTYGDSALQALARIIKASTRDVDIAARYGGEEFAIILPEATSADSLVVAKRLVKSVA
ncbi:MAG: diguanylate cyclase [Firmicutes bacterium]|nr:diguanylate cyclase [Bacillota bacterium]